MQLPWIYDIETYPNIFTFAAVQVITGERRLFEISDRRNDVNELIDFLLWHRVNDVEEVGFNSVGFDYTVVHYIIENRDVITVEMIYTKAMSIINTPFNQRFNNVIRDYDRHVKQVDLFLIRHFDNTARATSLKVLEFNMRMDSVEDLPFPVGISLDDSQKDVLIDYNWHDVGATELFYWHTLSMIRFRQELSAKYDHDFTNYNDTKIGKQFFIMKLEQEGVPCFEKINGRRSPRQTVREHIDLRSVIFDYVQFERPEFQRVLAWLQAQVITETKGVFKDIHCTVDGFQFDFGTGGIHGSVDSQIVWSDDDYIIEDWDVASYYPNLAIANRLFPAHLGEQFCDIYQDVYLQRKGYAKGTAENAMLKLALNGVYGDSNNQYSPFFDPAYTMAITINGQLLLCMLAEQLMKTPDLTMVQINTDGLTVKYPRAHKEHVHAVCKWWEQLTNLELEDVEYNRMFIRDVNNYIGEYVGGEVKRKGAYEYDLDWHQNHSCMVVAKAAETALLSEGLTTVRDFIENHKDIWDFMLRTKVPRSSKLVAVNYDGIDVLQQNVSRYHISTFGSDLVKIMPPTKTMINNGKTDDRRIGINTGWKVTICNNIDDANHDDIDYEYYIAEAEKLVAPLMRNTK